MGKTGAMILAAGNGIRMQPFTLTTPKVLLPVGGFPLLQWTLVWLKAHGLDEVAINLHHLGERIEDFVGNGRHFNMTIHYCNENELLGTALGAKRMSGFFGDTQVIVYGDVLADFNLTDMINYHHRRHAVATLALFNRLGRDDVGAVELAPDNALLSFIERPSPESLDSPYANGGVYVVNRAVFDFVPENGSPDFGHDVLPRLLSQGMPVYGYKLREQDYLLDIGTPERYTKANRDALYGRVKPGAVGVLV
jgi:NDP-sugar pyrophosphorylase family protein